MSWFSCNTSIKFFLRGFTLNQQGFLSYLRRCYEEDAGPLEEPAAAIDGAKAQYTQELRRLKKVCNRIVRVAKLLTLWHRHEMMLYMKVTCTHWLAFGTLATLKLNGMRTALGGYYCEENSLQEQSYRCAELLEVALAINGFRADSLREHGSSYHMRFALVLSDSLANNAQPREVSEKICIFSCRWKIAPEAVMD